MQIIKVLINLNHLIILPEVTLESETPTELTISSSGLGLRLGR